VDRAAFGLGAVQGSPFLGADSAVGVMVSSGITSTERGELLFCNQ